MKRVFISYSTENQILADYIYDLLEKNKVNVWMAPKDIPAGSEYPKVINNAIKDCSCILLVLTNSAQHSIWVSKEIERAIHYKKMIIPIQFEDMILNDEFEFYTTLQLFNKYKKFKNREDNIFLLRFCFCGK